MKIALIDINKKVVKHWAKNLEGLIRKGTVCIHGEALEELKGRGFKRTIVSPGNSFGFLGGGFDLAIREYFGGVSFEKYVRYKLMHSYVPVTNCTVIPLHQFARNEFVYLLHIPTVVAPRAGKFDVRDPVNSGYRIVFDVTWNALHFAPKETEELVIPGLCTGYAGVPIEIACKAMSFAIRLFFLKQTMMSQDLVNVLIMSFMGYRYEPFINDDCKMECERLCIDWGNVETFNPHRDPLESILPD